MRINIAALNIQSGVATTKGRHHYVLTGWKYWLPHSHAPIHAAGTMLKTEDIDIACITEVTDKSLRSGFRSQMETLAANVDMNERHFFSSQRLGRLIFHEGNALLSKYPIAAASSHLLHRELNMRMALEEAAVEVCGHQIGVFIAHLALTRKHREIQIGQIIQVLKERKGPMIFAGDFNEKDPQALKVLLQETPLKQICTAKTFPSWDPKYPFDYVLLSSEFTVLDCYTQKRPAFSDHLALIVQTELAD